MIDLVGWTLEALSVNWNDDNYDPQPLLINRDDVEIFEESTIEDATIDGSTVGLTSDGRSIKVDLTVNNAISVGSSPDRQNTAIGTEYDHRFIDGVSIQVEGAHTSEWGHLDDGDEFQALYQETRRALAVERVWPIRNLDGDEHYHSLFLENEVNESANNGAYYNYQFDCMFHGYEDLP